MRRAFTPTLLSASDERIRRLEDEISELRDLVVGLAPTNFRSLLRSYYLCKTREDTYGWKDDLAEKIIEAADVLPQQQSSYFSPRAYCPLCGFGSMSPHEEGFSLPEGLRRHLVGWGGRTHQCQIMVVAERSARDYWNREFAQTDAEEARRKAERKAERLATETLFRTTPYDSDAPELLDDRYRSARSKEDLKWAEDRLEQLGFQALKRERVISYILEDDNCVVYADPRTVGQITFRVFKKPIPKRKPNRFSITSSFSLQDRWKSDLKGKFLTRLNEVIAR